MNILQAFSQNLTAEITVAEPEALMDDLICSGIAIADLWKKTDLVWQIRIRPGDYPGLSQAVEKRGGRVTVIRKQGLYWKFLEAKKRPVLLVLVIALTFLSLFLPTRILLIEVEGNQILSDHAILEAAARHGIQFGARRSQIRSETVKNNLLVQLPQLQWAGINTSGCRAVISVREGKGPKQDSDEAFISDLVAEQDAYILSATVTGGTLLVRPGDIVLKDQVLISGYSDRGLCIRAGRASGEIMALTSRHFASIIPANCTHICGITDSNYKISLLIGKKRINLWKDSRISDMVCGRMYTEYFVSLPGGYRLPVAVAIDRYDSYTTRIIPVPQSVALASLKNFSDTCLLKQMIAGQIMHKKQQLEFKNGAYVLTSDYRCTEIIGKERREQIGDRNGERN